jgi:hypothetical protein
MNYLQTGHCPKCGAPFFTANPAVIRDAGLVVFAGQPDPDVYFSCVCSKETQKLRQVLATLETKVVIA